MMIRRGKFDPYFMISTGFFSSDSIRLDADFIPRHIGHRVKVDEFAELYAAFDQRNAGVMKVFVETKFR